MFCMSVVALDLHMYVYTSIGFSFIEPGSWIGLENLPISIFVYMDLFCLFSINDFMMCLIELW
jgi:hypothetical protein